MSMAGMNETARMIALEMISILALNPEEILSSSKYSVDFPGVEADEVVPGIFIGNK